METTEELENQINHALTGNSLLISLEIDKEAAWNAARKAYKATLAKDNPTKQDYEDVVHALNVLFRKKDIMIYSSPLKILYGENTSCEIKFYLLDV